MESGFRYLLVTLLMSALGAKADGPLGLREVLHRADEVNLTIEVSRELTRQARAVALRGRADLMPGVNLDLQQRRTQFVNIGRGIGGSNVSLPPSGRFDGKVTVSAPLVDLVARASYRAALLGVEVAELDLEAVRQIVLDATAAAYFTHGRNLRRMEVIHSNLERARVLHELALRRFEAGISTQIDVTRAEAQLAIAEQARLQQETEIVESELRLKHLLDLAPDEGVTWDYRRLEFRPLTAETPGMGFEERPDYLRVRRTLDQNAMERRAARWGLLPTFNLQGEYGYVSARAFDGNEQEAWLLAATLRFPVFDGFRIRSNRQLAEARYRAQEVRVRQLEQQIVEERIVAQQNARSRLAQIAVAEKNQSLAEQELQLARNRFEQGVADNREVVDAQNNLDRASDNLVEARYQYNLSRLEIARVRGRVEGLAAELAE